jgi:nucleotidyltransferase substrate binding protein (TIGR01987 family)
MNDPAVLEDFEKSLRQLERALSVPADDDLIKAGSIQYFEFCFELSWKSIQSLARRQGLTDCLSPKACLRQAFANGWIKNEETWLQMLEARNKMSHTYDMNEALKVYSALKIFLPELQDLLKSLRETSANN